MHHQIGSSFIEITISMVLLSIILLGFDGMQIIALREAKSAYYYTVAMQQLHTMLDQLEISDGNDMPQSLLLWNKQNREVLPDGYGVMCHANNHRTLAIFWGGATEQGCHGNHIGQSGCIHL